MELKAKITQLLPLQSGEGKNGPWKKQEFVVETEGQYPKKVCFSVWGDKINESVLQEGNMINIHFDAESREFNSKWYTELKVWKIDYEGATNAHEGQISKPNAGIQEPPFMDIVPDDLPF